MKWLVGSEYLCSAGGKFCNHSTEFLVLAIMLYCTFRRVGLLPFYIFFESRLIPTLFLILGWDINLSGFRLGSIYCFIRCWLRCLCW